MLLQHKDDHPGEGSGEPWEIEFVHHELPAYSEDEITRVLDECKEELHGSADRNEILKCVRRKLA